MYVAYGLLQSTLVCTVINCRQPVSQMKPDCGEPLKPSDAETSQERANGAITSVPWLAQAPSVLRPAPPAATPLLVQHATAPAVWGCGVAAGWVA
jgi:hypothetical protein